MELGWGGSSTQNPEDGDHWGCRWGTVGKGSKVLLGASGPRGRP